MRLHRGLIAGVVLALSLAGCAFPDTGSRVYEPGYPVYGGGWGNAGGGWGNAGGGWGNSGLYENTRNACLNEAADHDFRIGRIGQQQRLGDGRYAIAMELQRGSQVYTATCVFDAQSREARLRNVQEARNYGDQFASYADARRVCAGAAENRGWVVERVGDANAIGSSRFVVPLRVRTVGHSNNSDRIDCVWDARENRVRFSQS
jgi:hypothetical protein